MSDLLRTPPRQRRGSIQTPKTPAHNLNELIKTKELELENIPKTPKTPKYNDFSRKILKSAAPITPDFTPHRSNRKKKIDDIKSSVSIHNLLQPNPNRVGSGRKYFMPPTPESIRSSKTASRQIELPLESLREINKHLNFEEDEEEAVLSAADLIEESTEEDTEEDKDEEYEEEETPSIGWTKRQKKKPVSNLHTLLKRTSPNKVKLARSPSIELRMDVVEPTTPKANTISDSLVHKWHGKSFNNQFSSDEEDDDVLITKRKLTNPFVSRTTIFDSLKTKPKSLFDKKDEVNPETHITLVNKKGDRIIREMTEVERAVKPKKLNFNKFLDDNDSDDSLDTPLAVRLNNRGKNVNHVVEDERKKNEFKLGERFVNGRMSKLEKFEVYVDESG